MIGGSFRSIGTASNDRGTGGDPGELFVAVLGAHRSGTSLCAHVLSALDIDMADDPTPLPSNPKGHWERWEIVEFHERILNLFNRGYRTPLHDLPMPPQWWADRHVSDIKAEIMAFLARRMVAGVAFGFKDPRTARLLRLWQPIFDELGRRVKIVVCLRNPAQVARSLHERDGLPLDMGEYRWFTYMTEIFANLGTNYCTIEYETWFDGTRDNVAKLIRYLGLDTACLDRASAAIDGIVDAALRHDDPGLRLPKQPLIRTFYEAVRRFDVDAAARLQAARMVHQFNQFIESQQSLTKVFEQLSRLAAGAVGADREPPILSWRDPRLTVGPERRPQPRRQGSGAFEPEAAGNVGGAASDLSAVGSAGRLPRPPVFFQYDPVSPDAGNFNLSYRAGASAAKEAASGKLQVSLRWFDSRGRVLIWETGPANLDLSETGDWQQASLGVPLFPSRMPWLRFELRAAGQPEKPSLCTGFLLSGRNGILPPNRSFPVAAYTHAPLSGLFSSGGLPFPDRSAPGGGPSANAAAATPSLRATPAFIDIGLLGDAEILIFVDCDCFGRRLVAVQLPPPSLRPGARLMMPAVTRQAQVFGFGQATGQGAAHHPLLFGPEDFFRLCDGVALEAVPGGPSA